jgi:hypothetical protein
MAEQREPTNGHPPDTASGSSGASQEPRTFDLDTIDPHDAVRINGESYRLMRSSGLSLIKQAALSRAWTRMKVIGEKIQRGELLGESDAHEYRKLAVEMASLALPDAPMPVIDALSDEQLDQVILTFFLRTATAKSGLPATVRELMPQTSAPTSPSSSGSTAATP